MLIKSLIFLTFLSLVACQFESFKVIGEHEYYDALMRRFVYHFEEAGVSATETLPMKDFDLFVNETENGFSVLGHLKMDQGFVMKIKAISLPERQTGRQHVIEQDYATLFFEFDVDDCSISYATEFNLTSPEVIGKYGGIEIVLKQIKFEAGITKDFMTDTIKAKVEFRSFTNTINHVGVRAFPYDQGMQMAVRSFKKNHIKGIRDSITAWDLSKFMQMAAVEVPFPELCYHCDGKQESFLN